MQEAPLLSRTWKSGKNQVKSHDVSTWENCPVRRTYFSKSWPPLFTIFRGPKTEKRSRNLSVSLHRTPRAMTDKNRQTCVVRPLSFFGRCCRIVEKTSGIPKEAMYRLIVNTKPALVGPYLHEGRVLRMKGVKRIVY